MARRAGGADDGPSLRIATANLLMVHPSPEVTRAELETFDADVLLLQEYSLRWESELTAAGFFVEYPHHVSVVREDSFGVAILSRVPLGEAEIVDVEGLPMGRARLDLLGREIEVWSVHTLPPRTLEYTEVWQAQMEVAATTNVPVLLMGDFNAAPHNPTLQALALDSAHVECGMGGETTFPNGVFPVPELRMDHAPMHGELGCVALRHGVGEGSDHRPVVLDLGWR
ncbi:MAG: endonuclease/exonuclease/phosphatase family protein [Proteobacteria bacterium]|nr:endonuclease/exonuclease/phosphatase family protein [Pseudomonadota bacterium]MCP4922255.1 endonuclease/exonuclease/phosphatase family protein [Pseudomonadota bacterium]